MSAESQHSAAERSLDGATVESTMGRRTFLKGSVAAASATAAAATASPAAAQGGAYGGWFDDVDNYEGTLDFRGNDEVTVAVGGGDNGLRFGPPAILVDPGTTVIWEWTGEGGEHNVVHQPDGEGDPAFESELQGEAGATFEQTFEEEGTFKYYCSPHRAVGMKGAVAVGSVDDELISPSGGGGGGGGSGDGGQPLSSTDMLVAAVGGLIALALVLVVVRPGTIEPDRT